jgi:DNA-3-methyladenine glycosylase
MDFKDSSSLAKSLLGMELINEFNSKTLSGYIVETESYDMTDSASHSYIGLTKRNWPMFEKAGTIYIYQIYGLYYCLNIVSGTKHSGQAVLIRAIQPVQGLEWMKILRGTNDVLKLANGPAKVFSALNLDTSINGQNIFEINCPLSLKPGLALQEIIADKRVGISKNTNELRRFYIKDNIFVSKK